ncbi:MAG: hypothetical protein QM664_03215 [Flavihumibacter sp.]
MKGADKIGNWQRSWQREQRITWICFGLCQGLLLAVVAKWLIGWQGWLLAVPLLLAVIPFALLAARKKVAVEEVTGRLDQAFPSLEESSSLLVSDQASGSLLFTLQQQKTEQALQQISPPQPYRQKMGIAVLLALLAAVLLVLVPAKQEAPAGEATPTIPNENKAPVPLQLASASIRITPPAYTRLQAREQQPFALQTVQGADVQWTLQTNKAIEKMQLLFNDSSVLPLRATDSSHTRWQAVKKLEKSGFYRVDTDGLPSDIYTIDVLPDLPPVVNISSPEGQTLIEAGMPFEVMIRSQLKDDYGLVSAHLAATIASGSGEAVKFRNEKIDISSIVRDHASATWNRLLDLRQWQMKGGDELYFYLEATDGRGQASRSDICIVRLPDTTELLSMDGMLTAMDVKPEFFRSQRQIIIETEQLIRDKKNISVAAFQEKSNELGGEQKLLRLRYGKFLGEENETNIGGHHDHDDHDHDHDHDEEAHNDAVDFNNAEKILEEVTHKHDIAEDATFFDPETKKQLKATLTEMWNAELKLRIYNPEQALPYEYKALRLLKDLQQQSRVFVGKTGVKTTPLDPAKRGSGDQDKIIAPRFNYNQSPAAGAEKDIAAGLVNLQAMAGGARADLGSLQKAAAHLSAAAAKKPASLLPCYKALLRVMDAAGRQAAAAGADIDAASSGLASLLEAAPGLPAPALSPAVTPVSKEYLKQLSHLSD